MGLDRTHDPARRSWVESANAPESDFPIQNLPLCAFVVPSDAPAASRIGVGIGDAVLDVGRAARAGLLPALDPAVIAACQQPVLNDVMACGPAAASDLRHALADLLDADGPLAAPRTHAPHALLVPMHDVAFVVPMAIGDYSDFYASIHHATNVGSMFRPEQPLLPNYKYIPIGYHGRASSIVITDSPVRRPRGQGLPSASAAPVVAPTTRLDYELEVGIVIGRGNALGDAIAIEKAESAIFGLCLVNDWSARDIQAWEYQPLGPFLAKSFATTVSPWVITMAALAPFRVPAAPRPDGDPAPLAYLASARDAAAGGVDAILEVFITTERMRAAGARPHLVSRGNFREMYWTVAQLVAHHTSNGCNLRPGDLLASGTVSGPSPESRGCLLERTWRGEQPLELPGGERRAFLEDGDEVILRGHCSRPGYRRIGFGESRGRILPAAR